MPASEKGRSVSAANKQEIHATVDVPHKARGQSQSQHSLYGAGFDWVVADDHMKMPPMEGSCYKKPKLD